MHVTPLVRMSRIACPLVGNADATGECDFFVAYENLPMRPLVDPPDPKSLQRPKPAHIDIGSRQCLQMLFFDRPRAEGIKQNPNPHASSRGSGESLRKILCNVAGPIDIRSKIDSVFGTLNGREHGGKNLAAILQRGESVAAAERYAQRIFERIAVAFDFVIGHVALTGAIASQPMITQEQPARFTRHAAI